jgi:NAD(P) transhydrogenase subunit alpha
VLLKEDTVKAMKPGSVIVDMAIEQGGNRPLTERDKIVIKHGVKLIGIANLPALVAPMRAPCTRATCSTSSTCWWMPRPGSSTSIARMRSSPGAWCAPEGKWSRGHEGRRKEQAMTGAIDPTIINLTVFVLAVFVGYHVIWNVTPALHTPLMSVTNAISSVIIVGAILAAGAEHVDFGSILGGIAVGLAAVNVFGGFLVTQRMLEMFKKKEKKQVRQ